MNFVEAQDDQPYESQRWDASHHTLFLSTLQ